jgi:hypothetical protein
MFWILRSKLESCRWGLIGCPETSVINYQSKLHKTQKNEKLVYTAAEA